MSLPKIYIILFLLIFSSKIYSNTTVDSLLQQLHSREHSLSPKNHAKLLYEISYTLYYEDEESEAILYGKKALEESRKGNFDTLTFESLRLLSNAYYHISDYNLALVYLNEAKEIGSTCNILTEYNLLKIYGKLGSIYEYLGLTEKAYENKLIYVEMTKESKDSILIAEGIFCLAELDVELKKYDEAIKKINDCLKIYLSLDDRYNASLCYDLLGVIYSDQDLYPEALEYFHLSCDLDTNSVYSKLYCYNVIAELYLKTEDYADAFSYLQRAKKIRIKPGAKRGSEDIKTDLLLADFYAKTGKCKEAIFILNQYPEGDFFRKPLQRDFYERLFEANSECGNFKLAFDYQTKFFRLRDSIDNELVQKRMTNLSSVYQLKTKDQEVELLKQENEIFLAKKENELSSLYTSIISIILFFLVITLVIGVLMYKRLYRYSASSKIQKEKIEIKNKELLEANNKLKSANVELENFAFIASHDLKTPLRTIGSFASLIKRRYTSLIDDEGKGYLDFIISGVKQMNCLLEDVLAYSQIKKHQGKKREINLNDMLDNLLQILNEDIQQKNAQIVIHKLPIIYGDPTQIFQLFQNLITNSLKFVKQDINPIIEIKSHKKNRNSFCISVQDNGIGIHEDYQEQIFTIFKRLHTQIQYEGTGIGLSICQKIVERHGGEIWVDSDGLSGTTIYFTIQNN